MGFWRSFVAPIYSDVVGGVKDIASDVGSATNTLIVDPVKNIIEGGLDLTENTVNTGLNTAGSLLQGDISGAYSDLSGGVKNVGTILDETYMDVRDPLVAAAVIAGNYILPGSSLLTSQLVNEGAQDILSSSGGKTFNAVAGASGAYNGNLDNYGLNSTDPNAVGGVTGPDNIDVGGGWSPADGAAAAELEAARAALEQPLVETPPLTVEQITNDIANTSQPTGLTSADKQALYSNAGYGDTMTSAQISAFDKAIASGLTVSDALNYARVALLVNSLTGDPLGLSPDQPQQQISGQSGFAQVPIPAEWKSPTYAASSAPIDLSSIFSNQNMLGGTQWQGLPSQRNVSFNDIFAAGQQQTPMGTPVDINQIVSAILGQAATSQKSA